MTQARFLRACAANPGATIEALLPELLLDFNASQNVLGSLVSMGLVEVNAQSHVRLTAAGEARVKELVAHARRCEQSLFKGVPASDLATVTKVLSRIVETDQSMRRTATG